MAVAEAEDVTTTAMIVGAAEMIAMIAAVTTDAMTAAVTTDAMTAGTTTDAMTAGTTVVVRVREAAKVIDSVGTPEVMTSATVAIAT